MLYRNGKKRYYRDWEMKITETMGKLTKLYAVHIPGIARHPDVPSLAPRALQDPIVLVVLAAEAQRRQAVVQVCPTSPVEDALVWPEITNLV